MFTESDYVSGSAEVVHVLGMGLPHVFCNRIHVVSGTRCGDGSCSVVDNIVQKEVTVCVNERLWFFAFLHS